MISIMASIAKATPQKLGPVLILLVCHVSVALTQSQKKRKLSGQQDICRLNFPDKARKLRKFSNSRQMSVKGVHARS